MYSCFSLWELFLHTHTWYGEMPSKLIYLYSLYTILRLCWSIHLFLERTLCLFVCLFVLLYFLQKIIMGIYKDKCLRDFFVIYITYEYCFFFFTVSAQLFNPIENGIFFQFQVSVGTIYSFTIKFYAKFGHVFLCVSVYTCV